MRVDYAVCPSVVNMLDVWIDRYFQGHIIAALTDAERIYEGHFEHALNTLNRS